MLKWIKSDTCNTSVYKILPHALFHLILITTQWGRCLYYFHILLDEEVKARLFRICSAHQTLTINTLMDVNADNCSQLPVLLQKTKLTVHCWTWCQQPVLSICGTIIQNSRLIFSIFHYNFLHKYALIYFWPHLGYLSCKVSIATLMHLSSLPEFW